ncbi:MAG TPA: hypothetical protein VNU47_02045 [Candidatus Paceibacterota bacterium]|nr:hypothetical protein [Candidatus Paceibacterota bacterium]
MNVEPAPSVQFEEERSASVNPSRPSVTLSGWLVRNSGGSIQNEKQAGYVLIGFALLTLLTAGVIFLSGQGEEAEIAAPPGKEIVYPPNAPPRLTQ